MPYRRLPNTDVARLKALKCALDAGSEISPFKLAFSQSTLHQIRQFYPVFEQIMQQQKISISSQYLKSRELNVITRKAKLYISHFFQVLNFAVLRNELPASARKFYGLKENDSKIPNLNNEKDIIYWGDKLIKGESERIASGGNIITNPTSAVVRVRYEQFLDAIRHQKVLQKSTNYATDKISSLRAEADNFIQTVWNEVEKTFDLLPDDAKRIKAQKYGVTYVFRPNERDGSEADDLDHDGGRFVSETELLSGSDIDNERLRVLNNGTGALREAEKAQLQYSIAFTDNQD